MARGLQPGDRIQLKRAMRDGYFGTGTVIKAGNRFVLFSRDDVPDNYRPAVMPANDLVQISRPGQPHRARYAR